MAKGFGIAALVVAIIAIFVPFYGIHLSAIALILAALAALAGDRAFAVATPIIAAADAYFLTPSLWLAMKGTEQSGGSGGLWMGLIVFLAAPFVAIALNASGMIVLDRKTSA